MRRLLSRLAGDDRHQSELLRSLSDVASAVSTAVSLDDVLLTIVDRAKRITNTDKAILLLTQEDSDQLDFETLVVRGRVDQHKQDQWESLIADAAPGVFANGYITLDHIPETKAWVAYSPIRMQDTRIGILCAINRHDRRFSQQQMEFLAILGAFAATAIENARLAEEARYVLLASERNRIAGELHDGISQSLFSISLGLELAKKQVFKDPLGVSGRMAELQEQLNTAMVELRRVIYDLRPMKLQEMGLAGSIDLWIREVTSGRDVAGKLEVLGYERPLTASAEACLYRVAKEAVSNVIRHADASLLNVSLGFSDTSVCLTVSDDGRGFSPEAMTRDAEPGTGLGLRNMQQRVEAEGGVLTVKSAPDAGTVIRAELPVGGAE